MFNKQKTAKIILAIDNVKQVLKATLSLAYVLWRFYSLFYGR
jgi:hypothetical protein